MARRLLSALACTVLLCAATAPAQPGDAYTAARARMADDIQAKLSHAPGVKALYLKPLIAAMRATFRHDFVPPEVREQSYQLKPLPIGQGQTISNPLIVATMTAMLRVGAKDRVLEIGTGSGYQAAILSRLVAHVYTVEIVEPLAVEARDRVTRLGYHNIDVLTGDGYAGWPTEAPFDAIIVTAGAPYIPQALLDQLKPGGRMVIPMGPNWAERELVLVEKQINGAIRQRKYGAVFFVDFTGRMQKRH